MEMMDGYTHETFWLNGQIIHIEDILYGKITPKSDFEHSTLDFLNAWLKGEQNFTVQTSGSTGTPKRISITRQQMVGSARRTLQVLNIKPGQTALVCLPTQYIAGKMMLVRALVGNLKMVITEPSSNPLSGLTAKIDFAAFVPLQLQTIVDTNEGTGLLNAIRVVLIGGAKINPTLLPRLRLLTCNIILTYGMTETITHVAFNSFTEQNDVITFYALPGVTFTIDDRHCLVISDSNLNEKVITNDLVELLNNQSFNYLGRYDSVINSGGLKILPEAIENQLIKLFPMHWKYIPFFIGSYPDSRFGEVPAFYLEKRHAEKMGIDKIWHTLMNLKKLEQPKKIILIPSIYYTTTGKPDRKGTIEKTADYAIVIDKPKN